MLSKDSHESVEIHELWHIFHAQVPLEVDEEQEGSDVMGRSVVQVATAQVLYNLGKGWLSCTLWWSGNVVSPSKGNHQPLFENQDTSWIQQKAVTILTNWWTALRTPSGYVSSGFLQNVPAPALQGCWGSLQKLLMQLMPGLYSPGLMVTDVGQETCIGPAISHSHKQWLRKINHLPFHWVCDIVQSHIRWSQNIQCGTREGVGQA